MREKLSQKDYELINSYLDQELDRKDVVKFAERMAADPGINEEVADLMKVKAMVKELPTAAPPRNYILTRSMAEEARPKPWWERLFPVFRMAAAFCALALMFTFLFPVLRQQSNNSAETQSVYSDTAAESMAAESVEFDGTVQKSASLYDQEIVLEDRDFAGAAEESYHAVMPSYGVLGGNPRIEYMMRLEEKQNSLQSASSAEEPVIPEGYISKAEAQKTVQITAVKIILCGGLLLSLCALYALGRKRKQLELQ